MIVGLCVCVCVSVCIKVMTYTLNDLYITCACTFASIAWMRSFWLLKLSTMKWYHKIEYHKTHYFHSLFA